MKEKISKLASRLLSGDMSLRLLSVILAIGMWSLVVNTEDPVQTQTFSNVEVEVINSHAISNLNQSYEIKSGDRISFSIRGKKSIVDKMKKTDFEVTADLSEMSSVNAVPIKIVAKKYADNIEIVFGNDKTMTLEIEDMQQIQVPVIAETIGEPLDGYTVGSKTTNPNLISIKGPISIVKDIKQVKVSVNISNAKDDIEANLTPICCDSDGNKIESNRITLDSNKIKVNVKIWKTKRIDLNVETTGTPAAGYTVGTIDFEPKYVYVTGEDSDLKEMSKLDLPSINISGKKSTVEKTIDLTKISLPDKISLAQSDTDIMVKINIDRMDEKDLTISSDDISIINNDQNYTVEFNVKKVKLQLEGLKSAISNVRITDLNPQIDLSGLAPGKHTVAVKFNEMNNVQVTGSKKVTIDLIDRDENNIAE
ncbi:MAG: CdaR family protein [Lachnospiraceae bacterium]|nr:CdaR family protein [Lachnospiraceae bacterium]